MAVFDKDEKLISDALEALDREINIPELMPGIQKKLGSGAAGSTRRRRPLRLILIAAAAAVVLATTAAAISLGGFDWLLQKAKPPFGDIVKPIEQSIVSQGIKVTAVAAQSYGDMAVLYVTLEDTQGLGRVTEDTQLSFAWNVDFRAEIKVQSMYSDMIYFDEETDIAAYQIRLGAPDTFDGQSLSLMMNGLCYGEKDLGEIQMSFDLAEVAAQGEHIGQPYSDPKRAPSEQLTPGHVADIPGTDSAWVSAIGVSHGYLAVQFAQPVGVDRHMNPYRLNPYLLDAARNRVEGGAGTGFQTDAQLQPVRSAKKGVYIFWERYFTVDTDALEGYTLCFEGSAWNLVTGEWNLNVDFGNLQKGREVTADITAGPVQLKDVVININPFGMTLTGSGADSNDWFMPQTVKTVLETTKGDIELQSYGGSQPDPNGPYELVWHAAYTIDLDSVTAVRIGDNRIALTP